MGDEKLYADLQAFVGKSPRNVIVPGQAKWAVAEKYESERIFMFVFQRNGHYCAFETE